MQLIANLLKSILSVLPNSPFQSMITRIEDSTILSILNWFIPFGAVVSMLEAWAVCMAAYYLFKYGKSFISSLIRKFTS